MNHPYAVARRQVAGYVAASWISAVVMFLATQITTLHLLVNAGLVVTGLLIMLGVILARHPWGRGRASAVTALFLLLAGFGYVIAGLNPADLRLDPHILGTLMIMMVGNVALLVAGWIPAESPLGQIRVFSRLAGGLGLVAGLLHFTGIDLGLGRGGMERVASFPLLTWLLVAAIALTGVRRPPPRRLDLDLDSLNSSTGGTRHHGEVSANSPLPRQR